MPIKDDAPMEENKQEDLTDDIESREESALSCESDPTVKTAPLADPLAIIAEYLSDDRDLRNLAAAHLSMTGRNLAIEHSAPIWEPRLERLRNMDANIVQSLIEEQPESSLKEWYSEAFQRISQRQRQEFRYLHTLLLNVEGENPYREQINQIKQLIFAFNYDQFLTTALGDLAHKDITMLVNAAKDQIKRLFSKRKSGIEVLELRHELLERINTDIIRKHINIYSTQLCLNDGFITRIPERLFELPEYSLFWTHLRKLEVKGSLLTHLPQNIHLCPSLLHLILRQCPVNHLPDELGALTSLRSLIITNSELRSLPSSIKGCVHLNILCCPFGQLSALPDEIGQCSNLTGLWVSGNQLSALPETISQCTRLKSIRCDGNAIHTLPEQLGDCLALESLDTSNNQLDSLPDSITQCTALKKLHCQQNTLRALPENIGDLSALTVLNCIDNHIMSLPDGIVRCNALQKFYCTKNNLKALPDNMNLLSNLEWLECQNNEIEVLPAELGACPSLTAIYVSNNSLRSIPHEVVQSPALTTLDCHNNKLTSLPIFEATNNNLQWVCVTHNELRDIPKCYNHKLTLTSNEFTLKPQQGPYRLYPTTIRATLSRQGYAFGSLLDRSYTNQFAHMSGAFASHFIEQGACVVEDCAESVASRAAQIITPALNTLSATANTAQSSIHRACEWLSRKRGAQEEAGTDLESADESSDEARRPAYKRARKD